MALRGVSRAAPADDRPRSPFHPLRPTVGIVALYAAATGIWLIAGARLPGGRWLAVHLFTLGVLSNLVAAFTVHFAQTLLHQPGDGHPLWRLGLFNVGTLGVLTGVVAGWTWLIAISATAATLAVLDVHRQLRRLRRNALSQRFAFLVRTYERACGAFVHGAVLGALLGAGVVPAAWYGGVRLAHLHTNVLGWGGLTLLSTLVVFGPTVLRTRMIPGADAAAARWLPRAATGLTVGVLAMVVTGAGGTTGTLARLVAAGGLAAYTVGAVVICSGVLRAAATSGHRSANGVAIAAVCLWLPLVAAGDTFAVATGRGWLLSGLGAAALVGVLAQAIVAALGYVAPMLRRQPATRLVVRRRMDHLPLTRAGVLNAGVALLVAATFTPLPAAAGVLPVVLVVVAHAVTLAWPVRQPASAHRRS